MDALEIIRRTIEEHHKIRGSIKLVGETVNDLEAAFSLQQAQAEWAQSSVGLLSEKKDTLKRTVQGLAEGLNNHFGFEEKYLPPVFGEMLMKALIFEHNEIRRHLAECAAVVGGDIAGLPREKLLARQSTIQNLIGGAERVVEDHASREETILRMLERALQQERRESSR